MPISASTASVPPVPQHLDTTEPRSELLWYAGFGSNLNDERFALYLSGGQRSGLNRVYRGARDPSPPQAAVTCTALGAMRFAGQFDVWGSGGGASFFARDPQRVVLLRAFQVRQQQLADLVVQENGLTPYTHAAVADAIQEQLQQLTTVASGVAAGGSTLQLGRLPEDAPYDQLHLLDAHGFDGRRYPVLVLGTSRQPAQNPPPPEYLEALRDGLERFCGLSAPAAQRYLQTCLDNR